MEQNVSVMRHECPLVFTVRSLAFQLLGLQRVLKRRGDEGMVLLPGVVMIIV